MKDTALYLEVDEDITSAIDKLQKVSADAVQIVVPKRSTMLQSVINLKLLKKAATDSGKKLVLVTNDRIASDLAGRVGLAVAPSLGAEAVMGAVREPEPASVEEVIEADEAGPTISAAAVAAATPSAQAAEEAAKKPLFSRPSFARRPVNDAPAEPAAEAAAPTDGQSKKAPKVPNFNQLQRRLVWVGGAVALVMVYLAAMYFLSSAKVTLYAIGTKTDIDLTFAADPSLKQTDTAKSVLAAQTVTVTKDVSGSFTATGKKDVGTKASGTMAVSNSMGVEQILVAGTQFSSPAGRIFRSGKDITVPAAHLNSEGDKVNGQMTVEVTADQNGDSYNEAPATYGIPKLANPKVTAQGSQMQGGTSKVVATVTQADIDKAKADLVDKDKDSRQKELDGRVPSGYRSLEGSQVQKLESAVSAPAVDQEATSATLTLKVTTTALAVKTGDYGALIRAQEQKQIGAQNQIYNDGLDSAKLTMTGQDNSGRQNFHLTTQASSGSKLNEQDIAAKLKGQRYGDAADTASKLPGVERAEVSLKPAWSTHVPSRTSQIKIVIEVAEKKGE